MVAQQPLRLDGGVELRGGNAGVTEHFLHGAQVSAGLQNMRGKRMSQQMRVRGAEHPLFDAPFAHA